MSDMIGTGDFIVWDGGCLMIGRALAVTPMHAHYALQIGLGSEPGIRFRSDERHEWTEYDAAIIPSHQPHTMDATRVPLEVVIFIEPETPQGRALTERCVQGGIAPLSRAMLCGTDAALFSAWQRHGTPEATSAAAQELVRVLAGGVGANTLSDERIVRATRYINSHLHAPLALEDVASEACLSPSRFRHLFVEQTGTTLRAYVLWRRFVRAWEVVTGGGSLSSAAHAAGFADAAHLTRTCNRMFGFPPSALQVNVRRGRTELATRS